jgi:hypothetical protein
MEEFFMKYYIYQTNENYNLFGWNMTKHNFDLKDYYEVYNGELNDSKKEDIEILDELFEIFNINHPKDYHARSLSVGDVVQIIRGNIIKYYYCDMIGWQLILSSMKEDSCKDCSSRTSGGHYDC